ncbi:alpha-2A adrenergic receptor-like isoform X2 [Penaeus japonicus]|uniref:alpha-2A adrenergic receptor-like isoform X2 n=1 Tax=Penaeus japonicus TaxID=27405 RepID=UPI001C7151CC|nr:alpha-2A adrenergic receptor-like isoform X2 [Penaeus japonicus]
MAGKHVPIDLRPEDEYHHLTACQHHATVVSGTCDGRMSLPLMIVMLVLGFITFFVNLGVIIRTIKILRHSHDNKPAFYFIGNLALSDLAIGLYVIIAFLLHMTQSGDLWQQTTCTLQIAVAVTACQETIFTIVLIAVDKYLYICHGLKYHQIVTTNRVYAAVMISWVLSLIIGWLPAMGMKMSWEESCSRCAFAQVISPNFSIIFFITSVAFPYAVVVTLYSMLLVLAIKMQKSRYGGAYTGRSSARSSNFRLSLMSKKSNRSTKSSSTTTTTSSSSGTTKKAGRRQTRRKALEEYKATLPDFAERDVTAKLIAHRSMSEDEEDGKGDGPREGGGKVVVDGISGGEGGGKEGERRRENGGSQEKEILYDDSDKDESRDSQVEDGEKGDKSYGVDEEIPYISPKATEDGVESEGEACVQGMTEGDEVEENTGEEQASEEDIYPSDQLQKDEQEHSTPNKENSPAPCETNDKSSKRDSIESSEVPPPKKTPDEENGDTKKTDDTSSRRKTWLPTKYFNRVVTDTRDKVLFLKKCRAVKTVLLIIGSFTATYVPFVVGAMVYCLEEKKRECLLHLLNTLLYCGVVANSLANPMLYAYGYREFRLKTKRFKGVFARERTRVVP